MIEDVYEDIGYRRGIMADDVYVLSKNRHENSIRIEYIDGMEAGKIRWIRKDIAEDLIRRGVAREV